MKPSLVKGQKKIQTIHKEYEQETKTKPKYNLYIDICVI